VLQKNGNKKRGRSPVFIGAKELLLFFSSRSGSRGSSFSRLGSVSSRSSSRGSSVSRLGFSRSGGRSRGSSRSRSGRSSSFFLLAASGQGNSEESSNEDRLIHGVSLSIRANKIQIYRRSGATRSACNYINNFPVLVPIAALRNGR
jgi:hypothetical protein